MCEKSLAWFLAQQQSHINTNAHTHTHTLVRHWHRRTQAYLVYSAYIYNPCKHKAVYVHVPQHSVHVSVCVCALMTRLMHSSCLCCCLCCRRCYCGRAAFGFHLALFLLFYQCRWKSLESFKLCFALANSRDFKAFCACPARTQIFLHLISSKETSLSQAFHMSAVYYVI